jgi:predicted MFS family arabinose efflux permease
MNNGTPGHDRSYEWKAVALLTLGFGLVGLDRWIIAPLFPFMMADLQLGYQDMGLIAGVLGISWGVFSTWMGGIADRRGRRAVVIPALVLFSLLAGLSGLATGLLGLLALRTLMGAAEGAYLSGSVAAVADASAPQRRGMNQGLQLSAFPLLGLGLGPIIATQLLTVVPDWRWVFVIVAIPGLLLAALLWRVLREPPHLQPGAARAPVPWSHILRARNVRVAMAALVCAMSCIFVMGSMVPNYLLDHVGLSPVQMGFIMSALGLGGFLGEALIAAASDYLGRKPVAIGCFAAAGLCLYAFTVAAPNPVVLFGLLLLVSLFCFGVLAIMTGPVATEAVQPALISSAIGIVSGTGEIFGGGIAPAIAGFVAERFGIANVFSVSLIGLGLGVLVAACLTETAPRRQRS